MLVNLFTHFPDAVLREEAETFDALLSAPGIKIERIISTGQATPAGSWYCQAENEWVILLRGSAGLRFESETRTRVLYPGDFVNIPAHSRHRVEWTDASMPTVWLVVHYAGADN
ncbi:cupin domain-containing protein [Enterobacteriaceae bacterium H20N1]|uniref:Cupin domain-containing protein n=1 Tax=Dryocola boscaweniae TaxID=2925397 RepID=A0A9X2WCH3_9ENTR|nr:cupin domain-containing protein [Dryocola boscaweniae]MCT4703844.1 cupin domain-containing protein [Dryocola boscaweniae]MCT4717021.1 cupin domain-containing protein [Dryocola boscaweniae]MCT4721012.1 cupin domain-containing protein [Dryocola boscaweniae]